MRKIHSHFVIDYYSYRSGLGRWNPLLKIIFTLAALLAVIGTEDIQIAGITFLCMVVLVIKIGKVPLWQAFNGSSSIYCNMRNSCVVTV